VNRSRITIEHSRFERALAFPLKATYFDLHETVEFVCPVLSGSLRSCRTAHERGLYDHLYGEDGATEVACWGHARSYCFKTLGSKPQIAREFLDNLRVTFLLERKFASKPRKQRDRIRQSKVKVLVDRHFALCRKYEDNALDGTPLAAALRCSLNQEQALRRFPDDGRPG